MAEYLVDGGDDEAVPLVAVTPASLDGWLAIQPAARAAWVRGSGFDGEAGSLLTVPAADGRLAMVLFGRDEDRPLWTWADLPGRLPRGSYRLDEATAGGDAPETAALGWSLGTYEFRRYK